MKMTKDKIIVDVSIKIKNPNKINLKVTSLDLDIQLNNSSVGSAKLDKRVVIKKMSQDNYDFRIQTKTSKVLGGSISGVLGALMTQRVSLKLKGYLVVRAMCIRKVIPVEHTQSMSISDIPLFK